MQKPPAKSTTRNMSSQSFAILNYGTPVLYQPAKIVRIVNIGEEGL